MYTYKVYRYTMNVKVFLSEKSQIDYTIGYENAPTS